MRNLQSTLERFALNRNRSRTSVMITTTLAVLVMFVVSILLTKPADSMTGQLVCAYEAHIHDEECTQLICTLPEHICDESCQQQECTIEHVCDENCLPAECPLTHVCDETCDPNGCNLVHICDENCQISECTAEHVCDEECQPQECTPHEHSQDCYELVCTKDEHEHSQDCYETVQTNILSTYYNNSIQIMEDEQTATEATDATDAAVVSEPAVTTVATKQWFESVDVTVPADKIELNDNLINTGDSESGKFTGVLNYNKNAIDVTNADLRISFAIDDAELTRIKNGCQYLYYELPEGVKFYQNTYGSSCASHDGNILTSYYLLKNDETTGKSYILFRITDSYLKDYINNKDNPAESFNCSIKFSANVSRDYTHDEGDRVIDFGTTAQNTPITSTIEFKDYEPVVKKSASIIETKGQKPVIEWTVVIENPTLSTDLTGYKFSDTMFDENKVIADTITVDPGDIFNADWTLKRDIEDGSPVTIKYRTPIDDEYLYKTTQNNIETNIAKIQKDDKSYTALWNVWFDNKSTITKDVTPDYKVSAEEIGNKLVWTVVAENKYQIPMSGYTLRDDAFTTATDIVVKDLDGNVIPSDKYTHSGNTILFGADVTSSKLTVTYKTALTGDTNTATLVTPKDSEVSASKNFYVDSYKPYKLEKTGNYDRDKNKVVWTIGIYNEDNNMVNIDGLTLKDVDFTSLFDENGDGKSDIDDITFTAYGKNFSEITKNISYTLTGDTITFSTDSTLTDYGNNPAHTVIVTYSVPPTDEEQALIDAVQPVKFTNTATINNDSYTKSVDAETSFDPTSKISKKLDNASQLESSLNVSDSSKMNNQELEWIVDIVQDTGFNDTSKTFIDVMNVTDNSNNINEEAAHYMNSTQQGAVEIYAKAEETDSWSTTPLSSDYYTITFYTDTEKSTPVASATDTAKSFEVKFSSSINNAYKCIRIKYSTTADISNVQTSPAMLKFNNTASYSLNKETSSYNVEIYDSTKPAYKKIPLDASGNELENGATVNLADTIKETINDVEYYIFGWKVDLSYVDYTSMIAIKDTFDDKFSLYADGSYKPKLKTVNLSDTTLWELNPSTYPNYQNYVYNEGENTALFGAFNQNYVDYFIYYTKVPVEEFKQTVIDAGDTGYQLNNTVVEVNNKYDAVEAFVNVIYYEEPVVEVETVITKDYIYHENEGIEPPMDVGNNYISYELDINPNASDLSNGDELIVKDIFKTESFDNNSNGTNVTYGEGLVDALLDTMYIYEVQPGGGETLLSASEYSYQYYGGESETVTIEPTKEVKNANKEWKFDGFLPGDIITVEISSSPNAQINGSQVYIYCDGEWFGTTVATLQPDTGTLNFDSEGKYYYTFAAPEGCKKLVFSSWTELFTDVNISAVRTVRTSAADLNLIVPDSKHLKIKYTYQLLKDGVKLPSGSILNFNNTATLIGNTESSVTVDEPYLKIYYSDAITSITNLPTIKKFDVSDRSVSGLEAQFKLAVYDGSGWKWCNAVLDKDVPFDISTWSYDQNDAFLITTTQGKYQLNGFTTGDIFALVEVSEPTNLDGYKYESASKLEPFYFAYATTPSSYPTGVNGESLSNDNVKTVQQNGEIPVTNNRLVDISVTKTWDEPQDNASITAELYWSYKKVLNGFPSEMTPATADSLGVDALENPVQFTDTYKWSNLPNGKNGKVIYYYVKETDYTINGTKTAVGSGEFSPIYRGNGINESDAVIQITNASSLQLKKVWCDRNNVPLPDSFIPVDEIEVKLWGKVNYEDTEELVKNGGDETFKITKADGWKLKLTPQQLDNYQYFTVEEVVSDELTDYTVSYSYNYEAHTGSIIITNKADFEVPYTDITVKKFWYDGDGTNRPTSLELKLMQSTNKSDWTEAQNQTPDLQENGNEWIFTYKNLLAKDASNNEIYYKVVETVPNGYTLTEINNEGVNSTPDENPIILANTKTLSIEIEKKWNESNHMLDKVLVDVYRSTDSNLTNPELVQENIEISATTSWKAAIEDLPAYDGLTGEQYYYTVSEKPESVSQAYTPSYLYNDDENAKSITLENGKVVVTNSYIYEPVLLPATGGNGTTIYYVIGMAIILIGCAAYIWTYKKSKSKN